MKKSILFLLLIIFPFMALALSIGDVDGNGKVYTSLITKYFSDKARRITTVLVEGL